MSARHILADGIRKRIGNGKSTNIWTDKWLIFSSTGKIVSEKREDFNAEMVSDLIENFKWKRHVLTHDFSRKDVRNILKIPISLKGRKDSLIWKYHQSGKLHC
ncbi:hypothetical protein ACH5RR_035094 [Cinchona calisaya]|uniref:Reverse transcriptase n=1 Tax=Cinchona calisaya TaxID=153742 RepID=A0ABD2YDY9_9GENT